MHLARTGDGGNFPPDLTTMTGGIEILRFREPTLLVCGDRILTFISLIKSLNFANSIFLAIILLELSTTRSQGRQLLLLGDQLSWFPQYK